MEKTIRGLLVACAFAAVGCTSSSTGSAGQVSGGLANGGPVGSSDAGAACGGDLVGAWTVTESCLSLAGTLDLSLFTLGCSSAPVDGPLEISGTWLARPDGTYVDDTTVTGEVSFSLARSCLVISSAPVDCQGAADLLTSVGFSALTCDAAPSGGCDCTGTVHHKGGLSLLSPSPTTSGELSTKQSPNGGALTITGDVVDGTWGYCVSASNELSLSPRTGSQAAKGYVRFRRVSSGPTARAPRVTGTSSMFTSAAIDGRRIANGIDLRYQGQRRR